MKKSLSTLAVIVALLCISSSATSENWREIGNNPIGKFFISEEITSPPNTPDWKEAWFKFVPSDKKQETIMNHIQANCQKKLVKDNYHLTYSSNGIEKTSEDVSDSKPRMVYPSSLDEKAFSAICKTPMEEFENQGTDLGDAVHFFGKTLTPTSNGIKVWELYFFKNKKKAPSHKAKKIHNNIFRLIELTEYNCNAKRLRMLASRTDAINGTKVSFTTDTQPSPWKVIIPNTWDEENYKKVCNKPISSKQ